MPPRNTVLQTVLALLSHRQKLCMFVEGRQTKSLSAGQLGVRNVGYHETKDLEGLRQQHPGRMAGSGSIAQPMLGRRP